MPRRRSIRGAEQQALRAVTEACDSQVARNLLIQRYGKEHSPQRALYAAAESAAERQLEGHLLTLFQAGEKDRETFGLAFDGLCAFLREHQFGCSWAFLSYLSFLAHLEDCFPFRPSVIDSVLHYFDRGERVSGYVSWGRYLVVLDLANALREQLVHYGRADSIAIQSYLWVVGHLVDSIDANAIAPVVDLETELRRRQDRAAELERIGLRGESFVLDQEQQRLRSAGRPDLAERVEWVARSGSEDGFDISSFHDDGTPRHIEVKTTMRRRGDDGGFWLSERERACAINDRHWSVVRVWSIDVQPSLEDIGNPISESASPWSVGPSSWFVRHERTDKTR